MTRTQLAGCVAEGLLAAMPADDHRSGQRTSTKYPWAQLR